MVLPEIEPGCEGAVVTTLNIEEVPVPQLLTAFTYILPPLLPDVALIELVVELPVQPGGNVQL